MRKGAGLPKLKESIVPKLSVSVSLCIVVLIVDKAPNEVVIPVELQYSTGDGMLL